MSNKIILIDLSAIFWRFWHISEEKEFTTARKDTISMVEWLIQDYDCCAVCIDAPPYNRSKIYPEYKAGRERKPIAVEELRLAIEELKKHGVPCYSAEGYEADDIIGTLACQAHKKELSVVVAGADKDLLQIPNITLYEPFSKQIKTPEETLGVPQALVAELLALTGDKADNIPGLTGIGPKKAASILERMSVPEIIACTYKKEEFDSFPDSVKAVIETEVPKLSLSYSLVTIDCCAPIEFDIADAKKLLENGCEAMEEEKEPVQEEPESQPIKTESIQPRNEVAIKSDARNANWSLALEPQTTNDAVRVATILHQSRLFGQFKNPESVMAILLRGRALGIDATTALSSFHVIKDRPTMHASLIVGLIHRSGLAEYFDLVESTEEVATWDTKRKTGRREVSISFTVDDAKNAKLLTNDSSSNWNKYRKTMLRWRAATELARAVYPDVTTGLYTPDEIETSSAINDF